jgi:hypothetical protein
MKSAFSVQAAPTEAKRPGRRARRRGRGGKRPRCPSAPTAAPGRGRSRQRRTARTAARPRPLLLVGENGQGRGIEGERGQQSGEARAQRRCQTGEQQHQEGRDHHPHRDVPGWGWAGACRWAGNVAWHQAERRDQDDHHHTIHQARWERPRPERGGRPGEDDAARHQRTGPGPVERKPAIAQAEGDLRERPGQDAHRGAAREPDPVIQRQEEGDRCRGEGQTDQPAAQCRPPPTPCQAGDPDQGGSQHDFEDHD